MADEGPAIDWNTPMFGLIEDGSIGMARGLFRYAEVLADDSPAEAQEKLSEARAIFEKLGNRFWRGRLERLEAKLSS